MSIQLSTPAILSLFTIGTVLVLAIVSFLRARRAQKRHEGAAVEERQRHEGLVESREGTPGGLAPLDDATNKR